MPEPTAAMKEIDVYKVLEGKNPRLARRMPRFVVDYLRHTIHEREVNDILARYGHLEGVEFVRAALGAMNVRYHSVGMERLDPNGRYVFASNHPFGGLDGLMLADEVVSRFGDARVVVNDLLMHLDPLRGLFVPVNKHGRQAWRRSTTLSHPTCPSLPFPRGFARGATGAWSATWSGNPTS